MMIQGNGDFSAKTPPLVTVFGKFGFHKPDLGGWGYGNKLAKLGDAIAISKSETMNHSLTAKMNPHDK